MSEAKSKQNQRKEKEKKREGNRKCRRGSRRASNGKSLDGRWQGRARDARARLSQAPGAPPGLDTTTWWCVVHSDYCFILLFTLDYWFHANFQKFMKYLESAAKCVFQMLQISCPNTLRKWLTGTSMFAGFFNACKIFTSIGEGSRWDGETNANDGYWLSHATNEARQKLEEEELKKGGVQMASCTRNGMKRDIFQA